MENISFDVVASLLLFLVGVPVLVLQFMAPEIRNVLRVERRIIRVTVAYLGICIFIIALAIWIEEKWLSSSKENLWVWVAMYAALFLVVGFSAAMVLSKYGFRENILSELTNLILKDLPRTGKPNEERLRELIEIGKESNPGPDRAIILDSMRILVDTICKAERYRGDSLENLIIGIVHVLATRPTVEDTSNYQTAAGILTTVLSSKAKNGNGTVFVDQFHAVNAMSTLGQTMLAQDDFSTEVDYILMDFEEALGLVVSVHSDLLSDVTQALLSMGSVAINHRRYLFAVAAFERMLTLIESNKPVVPKPKAELLGLAAHFWVANGSNRDFVKMRIPRISELVNDELANELEKASQRFQMTMRFDTADNLCQMAKELRLSARTARKKK